MTRTITHSKLLIVEGRDEEKFFHVLLKRMGIRDQFQIISVDGKDNFRRDIPLIVRVPDFWDRVASLAVIRDADTSCSAALQSIRDLLKKNDLPHPEDANTVEGRYLHHARQLLGRHARKPLPPNGRTESQINLCRSIPEMHLPTRGRSKKSP